MITRLRNAIHARLKVFRDKEAARRRAAARADLRSLARQFGDALAEGRSFEEGNKYFAIVSNTNTPLHAKFHCLLAKALQREGYTPVVINADRHEIAEAYFRLFGVRHYVKWSQFLAAEVLPHYDVDGLANDLLPAAYDISHIKAITYRNVQVGKYALSETCRTLKQGRIDFTSPAFQQQFARSLRRAVANALAMPIFFDRYPVALLMARDVGYVNSGPFLEAAVRRGIDSLVVARGQRRGTWILKRYTAQHFGDHEFSISKPTWQRLQAHPMTPTMQQRLDEEFAARYRADSMADLRRLQSKKQVMPPEQVRQRLGLDPAKKTAVIFAHVSWDGAFFFGEDLFDDFDDWLVQTTRAACANAHLNWIVKLHPLNVLKFAQEGKTEFEETEMVHLRALMPLPPHVQIMRADTPINTASLFPVIDYGLTVRGTIGMELPCFGIPSLTAGTGRYEGRGFTIDSQSKEAYLERLRRLHTVEPLSEAERQQARKHYYYLIICRQVPFDDIAPMAVNSVNEVDSDMYDDIQLHAGTVEDIYRAASIRRFVDWVENPADLDLMWDPDE